MSALWTVVIPVRGGGKTRLDVPGVDRAALAHAIAADTVAAAARCELVDRVIVVTGAPDHWSRHRGPVEVIDEGVAAGLNAAINLGMSRVSAQSHRAALLGDLPALRSEDLADALRAAGPVPRAVVADAAGSGSTLVTAGPSTEWASSFGAGSFARHRDLGFVPLDVPNRSTLRHDVDTPAQLDTAREWGLGPCTTAALGG